MQSTACDAGHELDRPVVVGRPEAARDEADVGLEPLAQRRLELVRVVADDRDARRLETEAHRFLSVERAVEIGSLAPHELTARHDDCCAGTRQELGVIVRCPLAGTLTRTPATRTTTLRGDATESQSLRDANRFVCPRWSVPRYSGLPAADPTRTSMNVAPFVAVTATPFATADGVAAARHVHALHLQVLGAAELPGGDHERREQHHRGHRDCDEPRFAMLALAPAMARDATGAERLVFVADDVARVVLVDVELAVHPERVRVRPQKALDVGVAGKLVELVRLEGAQVLRPHLRAELHLVQVEALARPGLAEA